MRLQDTNHTAASGFVLLTTSKGQMFLLMRTFPLSNSSCRSSAEINTHMVLCFFIICILILYLMFLYTQGDLRQLTFLMGDPEAAQQHCRHHSCGEIPMAASSPKTKNTMKVWIDAWTKGTYKHLLGLIEPNCNLFLAEYSSILTKPGESVQESWGRVWEKCKLIENMNEWWQFYGQNKYWLICWPHQVVSHKDFISWKIDIFLTLSFLECKEWGKWPSIVTLRTKEVH